MIHACPKPSPTIKAERQPLKAKKWGVSSKKPPSPLRKSGQTKVKKVARQKAFYSSAAWKRLRKEALERAGNRCQYFVTACFSIVGVDNSAKEDLCRCRVTENLHVHHRTNVRFGGKERPDDLMAICEEHHALIERRDHPHRQRSR